MDIRLPDQPYVIGSSMQLRFLTKFMEGGHLLNRSNMMKCLVVEFSDGYSSDQFAPEYRRTQE